MISVFVLMFLMLGPVDEITGHQDYEYIKIVNLSRKPIIEGRINGEKAYFLLDTGSDITILNRGDAEKFNFRILLRNNNSHKVASFSSVGWLQIYNVINVDLLLGTQQIKSAIHSYDLTHIIESIYIHTKIKISGIIGSDIMKRYGFKIDYSKREIGIKKKRGRKPTVIQ